MSLYPVSNDWANRELRQSNNRLLKLNILQSPLLNWLKSYLKGRQQVTIVNGVPSGILPVSYSILQGSVLGPTLFSMFTNDLPTSVVSGSVYMFADDTTIYCIGTSADEATAQLNLAMHELYSWCLAKWLKPHPGKSEGYFSQRELWPYFMGCLLQLR